MISEGWLNCKVVDGMFSDELVVIYQSSSGAEISVFVPFEKVMQSKCANKGWVKVEVFSNDLQIWAILPNDNRDEILINENELSIPEEKLII